MSLFMILMFISGAICGWALAEYENKNSKFPSTTKFYLAMQSIVSFVIFSGLFISTL